MKERLSCLFQVNELRCSRRVLYGADLLQACTLSSEPAHSALSAGDWRWVGRESCLRAQRTCVATTSTLQSTLLSVEDRLEAANSLIRRYSLYMFGTIKQKSYTLIHAFWLNLIGNSNNCNNVISICFGFQTCISDLTTVIIF